MYKKTFICTLKSDIVLNATLATEGNMDSLDYIPGSNFLGIVAKQYDTFTESEQYNTFHSGSVQFNNGYVAVTEKNSNKVEELLPMAGDIVKEKNTNDYKLHHAMQYNNYQGFQFKPQRRGYISSSGLYVNNILKSFTLKSAYDEEKRKSEEGKMFGFESMRIDQKFFFTINSKDENLLNKISDKLRGDKSIGKSKTAEYGNVYIEEVKQDSINEIKCFKTSEYILAYAASNLCFLDECIGQPTLQPSVKQLGLDKGEIDWSKSSVKSFSYSPWNGHRNCSNIQRDCIAQGSVFYIKGINFEDTGNNEKYVGEYLAEGLGRIIINPTFLEAVANEDNLKLQLKEFSLEKHVVTLETSMKSPSTELGKFLYQQEINKQRNAEISNAVILEINKISDKHPFLAIPSSQWGIIRNEAIKEINIEDIFKNLFQEDKSNKNKKGILRRGISAEKYWKDDVVNKFRGIIEANKQYGSTFVIKLASEIAKKVNS